VDDGGELDCPKFGRWWWTVRHAGQLENLYLFTIQVLKVLTVAEDVLGTWVHLEAVLRGTNPAGHQRGSSPKENNQEIIFLDDVINFGALTHSSYRPLHQLGADLETVSHSVLPFRYVLALGTLSFSNFEQ